jgi:hypothetical protein
VWFSALCCVCWQSDRTDPIIDMSKAAVPAAAPSSAAVAARDGKSAESAKYRNYKLVVFGSGAVGKSSITLRFVSNTFTKEYLPTVIRSLSRPPS